MNDNPVVRAFDLAKSGECSSILDVEQRLRKEGYSNVLQHLSSKALRKQLQAFINASKDTAAKRIR